MRLLTVSGLVPGLLVMVLFAAVRAEVPPHTVAPSLIFTSTPHYDVTAWLRGGERFPQGARLMLRSGSGSRAVLPQFFASADASVSFDGTHVLFAGKKSVGDHWQVWELEFSKPAEEPKQLTSCPDDCVRPLYLPDNQIVYSRKVEGTYQVEAAPLDGGQVLQLTYIPGNALPADVLHDGRVLFQSSYPLGEGTTSELYTVYPDGSGVESYRCDHGASRYSGRQMASSDIVFVSNLGLARFTSPMAHEVPIEAPKGEFAGDIVQNADDVWITSWRPDSRQHYSLREWNRRTGGFHAVVAESDADMVQPQVVAPHPIPNRFPSALHDWDGANVLCLKAYTSKLKIVSGSIASVQVYTQRDKKTVLLGQAHVEPDGSFFLHVPSDQPLKIELLDPAGNTVQREQGWFWMRKGEQRVCVGCHAGPERAPENAVPQVLVKSTDPADMTRPVANETGGR